jgi:hypothetical protein
MVSGGTLGHVDIVVGPEGADHHVAEAACMAPDPLRSGPVGNRRGGRLQAGDQRLQVRGDGSRPPGDRCCN